LLLYDLCLGCHFCDSRFLVRRGAETRLIAGKKGSGRCHLGPKAGAYACRCCAEVLNQVTPQAAPRVADLWRQAAAIRLHAHANPDIFEALQRGDVALVQDHLTVDASCVSSRNE
jgi:hypothetical protein